LLIYDFVLRYTARAKHSGAVHCNRSCLFVCLFVGLFVSVCLLSRQLEIASIDQHQTGSVCEGSDHLQMIKFWPSCAPGKGSAAGRNVLAPPYYSQRAVFALLHLCQFRRTLAYKPLRSRRRFTIFFKNCGF